MKLTYQQESFRQIAPELPHLFYQHWQESIKPEEKIPLDPDWERYSAMDAAGVLRVITARAEGKLVGYYFAVLTAALHSKRTLTAYTDMFYVLPEYREGWGGYGLFVEAEKLLRAAGVKKSYIVTKAHLPITIILKRLKYLLVEKVYTKLF